MHNLYYAMHNALLDYLIKVQRYKKSLIVNRCKLIFLLLVLFFRFCVVFCYFFSNFVELKSTIDS